jgi:hypothetical protein
MPRYTVMVVCSNCDAYRVEADGSADARDQAIERAMDENPFADDYEVFDVIEDPDDA